MYCPLGRSACAGTPANCVLTGAPVCPRSFSHSRQASFPRRPARGLRRATPALSLAPLRWRSLWVGALNIAHAASVVAFYPQLYSPDPAHNPFAAPPPAALSAAALAGRAAWLLWHSQALVMLLNSAGPLVNTFRYFLHSQVGAQMKCSKASRCLVGEGSDAKCGLQLGAAVPPRLLTCPTQL